MFVPHSEIAKHLGKVGNILHGLIMEENVAPKIQIGLLNQPSPLSTPRTTYKHPAASQQRLIIW